MTVSDGRKIGADGCCKQPVGNTVNIAGASYTNSIGDPFLAAHRVDPDFDAKERAFYYVRVIECPTPPEEIEPMVTKFLWHWLNPPHRGCLGVLTVGLVLLAAAQLHAGVRGSVTLRDGSIIHGEVVDMVEGTLRLRASFGAADPFSIKWAEVTHLATSEPVTFVLTDGTSIKGTAQKGEPGVLQLLAEPLTIQIPIQLAAITAINPPRKRPLTFRANANFGGKLSEGNTVDRQINFLGKFGIRSEQLRLNIDIRWFYAEEDGSVTDRNGFGTMKLDAFVTKRWYGYIGSLSEQDTFDDLDLRSTLTSGPGYDLIHQGDFTSPYFNQMELSVDVGFGFFSENRKMGEDDTHSTGRWGMSFSWPVVSGIRIFHEHQGFPSLEDTTDYYINALQGVAFEVWKGLSLALQTIYKYDNAAPAGTGKSDFKALLTIGYDLEF